MRTVNEMGFASMTLVAVWIDVISNKNENH